MIAKSNNLSLRRCYYCEDEFLKKRLEKRNIAQQKRRKPKSIFTIDCSKWSDEIPTTQKDKIKQLKEKHWMLFPNLLK